jgi:hypothetical protein
MRADRPDAHLAAWLGASADLQVNLMTLDERRDPLAVAGFELSRRFSAIVVRRLQATRPASRSLLGRDEALTRSANGVPAPCRWP